MRKAATYSLIAVSLIVLILILLCITYLIAAYFWEKRLTATAPYKLNGIKPVKHFNVEKYAGTWYEQKRIDFSFESGLEKAVANYNIRKNGIIDVVNTGIRTGDGSTSVAQGTARATQVPGYLQVSFFPLVESSYIILHVEYDRMVVIGSIDRQYLWLLTRLPEDKSVRNLSILKEVALTNGYTPSQLASMV